MLLQSVLLFAAFTFPLQVIATCYNPDGSKITDPAYQPCNNFQGTFSTCCGTNHTGPVAPDVCQSNGVCRNSGDGVFWRQGCTDPTWQSPFCLEQLCTNSTNGGSASKNVPVGQCSDGTWVCGGFNQTSCDLKLGVTLAATIGVTSTSTTSPTSTSTSTSTPASSSTQPPTSSSSPPDSSLSTGAKIGIGIGVAGGILAVLAILAACLIVTRRKSKEAQPPQHGNAPMYEAPANDSYKYQQPQEIAEGKSLPAEAPVGHHRAELPS